MPDNPHKRVTVALFDNPDTRAREAYQDGRLLCHLTADALSRKDFRGFPGMPFMLNDGPWSPGKFWGDESALPESARLTLARIRSAYGGEDGSHG